MVCRGSYSNGEFLSMCSNNSNPFVHSAAYFPLHIFKRITGRVITLYNSHLSSHLSIGEVGSGSAGGVVAARLAEEVGSQVLLLEAGGAPPIVSTVPGFSPFLLGYSDADWGYTTVPQKHGLNAYQGNVSVIVIMEEKGPKDIRV